MSLVKYIEENISNSFYFSENPFSVLYLDIIEKCNMRCKICYNSDLTSDNHITLHQFKDVLFNLKNHETLRLLGGEPTLHPNFFDILEMGRKNKNLLTVSSNGLMYADDSFMKELSRKRFNNALCGYGITLNGGLGKHKAYEIIDGDAEIYKTKLIALENLIKYKIKNISPSAIIVKGLNELVIKELVEYFFNLNIPEINTRIRFRSEGQLGSHLTKNSYTTKDFLETLFPVHLRNVYKYINTYFDGTKSGCYQCCCDIKLKDNLEIRQLEFGSVGAQKCWMRGYVDFENQKIYPFFEYQHLKTKYYEGQNEL